MKHRTSDGFTIERGDRLPRRHWMGGVSEGRVRVLEGAEQRLLEAEIGYPGPLVIGTLFAVGALAVASWRWALFWWAWFVAGNYVVALFAVRRQLKHAQLAAAPQAT